MSSLFTVSIAKVGESLFQGKALSLVVPGASGQLTILAHHEPLVTTLTSGSIQLTDENGTTQKFSCDECGVLEVVHNTAHVLL